MPGSAAQERFNPFYPICIVLSGMVLLFILAPLASMALHTSFEDLGATAADREVRESIWLTLWTSMAATLLAAVAAIPFAYLLARKQFPLKGLITALVDLPVVIPHSAAGIAVLGLVARGTLVGNAAHSVGIEFVGGHAGIMAAMAFVSVPFLINAARDGFHAVPQRLEYAALTLGASPARVFFTISVPLAWRAILTGLVLMWARGLSEFGAVVIVAYHPMITPVLIYERFGAFGLKYARPVAVLFIGVCLVLFVVVRRLVKDSSHAPR